MKKVSRIITSMALALVLGLGTGVSFAAPTAKAQMVSEAPVDINQASLEQLMTLKGVGAKTAERIVAYRNQHGSFQTIDQLVMVKGIGNAKFEKIRSRLTV